MIEYVDREPADLATWTGPVDRVTGGRTRSRALDRFASALGFPEWFGRNLDALADLLDDRAAESGGGWWLVWSPSRRLVTEHAADYADLVGVLADVADGEHRRVTVLGPDPATLGR